MKRHKQSKIEKIAVGAVFMFGLLAFQKVQAVEITPENVMKFVNDARAKQGVEVLVQNDKLMSVAKDKLNDMVSNKYFAHTSPKGVNPWYWFGKDGYDYQYAGENLAINFLKAEDQQDAWMKSPTHRKNILNPNYLETGVAVGAGEIDGQVSIIAVQEFGTLSGAVAPKSGGKTPLNKDTDLIKENGKIVPQVLSIKNPSIELPQVTNKNIPVNQKHSQTALDMLSIFFSLILFGSLILAPLAFMSVAFEKILIIKENIGRENKLTNQAI